MIQAGRCDCTNNWRVGLVRRMLRLGRVCSLAMIIAALGMATTSAMADGLIFIEGEDYFDGPANTLEGVGQKPACSGGETLYGYALSRKGLGARYQLTIESDMPDCRVTLRYSRFHWYDQPRTSLKIVLASMTRIISRQQEIDPTGGWGTDNSSQWSMLEISLGQVPAGEYMLSLEAMNEEHSDMNVDCLFVTNGPPPASLQKLEVSDRIAISPKGYLGIAVENRLIRQHYLTKIEVPCTSFKDSLKTDINLTLNGSSLGEGISICSFKDLTLTPDISGIAISASKVRELPDGKYTLSLTSSAMGSLELPLVLCGEFVDSFPARIAAIGKYYQDNFQNPASPEYKAYEADYRHALKYMQTAYAKLLEGKLNATDYENLDRTISQYELTTEKLSQKLSPDAQRTGDFRLAFISETTTKLEPYRIFLPASYSNASALPCILALNHTEDKFLDQADGVVKQIADQRGYVIISPAATSNYWGDGRKDLLQLIGLVLDRYPGIDRERLYCTGTSRGGFGCYSLSQSKPELFAAIACSSGVGDRRFNNDKWTWTRNLVIKPTLILQGGLDSLGDLDSQDALDSLAPVSWAEKVSAMMTDAGTINELHIFPSYGHSYAQYARQYFTMTLDFFDAHPPKSDESGEASTD